MNAAVGSFDCQVAINLSSNSVALVRSGA